MDKALEARLKNPEILGALTGALAICWAIVGFIRQESDWYSFAELHLLLFIATSLLYTATVYFAGVKYWLRGAYVYLAVMLAKVVLVGTWYMPFFALREIQAEVAAIIAAVVVTVRVNPNFRKAISNLASGSSAQSGGGRRLSRSDQRSTGSWDNRSNVYPAIPRLPNLFVIGLACSLALVLGNVLTLIPWFTLSASVWIGYISVEVSGIGTLGMDSQTEEFLGAAGRALTSLFDYTSLPSDDFSRFAMLGVATVVAALASLTIVVLRLRNVLSSSFAGIGLMIAGLVGIIQALNGWLLISAVKRYAEEYGSTEWVNFGLGFLTTVLAAVACLTLGVRVYLSSRSTS